MNEEQILSLLWWLCHYFRERQSHWKGSWNVVDVVEHDDNDKEVDFVDVNDNYHEKPQEEREKENQEDIVASTSNTHDVTSRRTQTSKKS